MPSFTALIVTIGSIIFVDLVLSGDNALVIGAVAAGMPRGQRRLAFILGGAGAITLRILFTAFATFILALSFLQAIGGAILLFIAVQLVRDQDMTSEDEVQSLSEENKPTSQVKKNSQKPQYVTKTRFLSVGKRVEERISPGLRHLLMAFITIVVADVSTSLDNIVAIAALAHGQFLLLSIGLFISIVILLIGSALIAELTKKIPALIIVAGLVLAWVSADLIINYVKTFPALTRGGSAYYSIPIYALTLCVVGGFAAHTWWSRRKVARTAEIVSPPEKAKVMRKG